MNKTKIIFNNELGKIEDIKNNNISLISKTISSTSIKGLRIIKAESILKEINCSKLNIIEESDTHRVTSEFEIYARGYVICTFKIETLMENELSELNLGFSVPNDPVLMNKYEVKNIDANDKRGYHRAISLNFSLDDRRITNSIDFMLENVRDGEKIEINSKSNKFLGWKINDTRLGEKGEVYSNRWCIHASSMNNEPNKVRGQRIYHWYGFYPSLPSLELVEEMDEYGCSILILHMPSFKWIDGSVPKDEEQFKSVIKKAHSYNIKMMFYMQPLLLSQVSPKHKILEESLNNNGKLCWHSLKDTQIVFYEPNSDYDCDELCLRCPDAYSYIKSSVLECYKKYEFDGLYIDFAWPSIAVCTNTEHGHAEGIFNFYDYLRLMRELRTEIGKDALMIGHGGSLLVSSDYAEGFDACLTGEGQKDLLPEVIGVQTGTVPTLWTMHRRKEKIFRSREAMAAIIREGVTPHIGLGVLGKSIMATVDPGHTPHFIALWQMWRAFPVEKSYFYNYLTENMLSIDNEEVTYSLYVTKSNHILLILCNGGGPISESAVSVEVNVTLNLGKLNLPKVMKSLIMRGNTYETFRIVESDEVLEGYIKIPEIGINEFVGVILYEDEIPIQTRKLITHLKKRHRRMASINENKEKRLVELDRMINHFNKLDLKSMSADDFMKNRTME